MVQHTAAPDLGSLPDALLVVILKHLDQEERLKHAALVCKRFQQLCCGPELAAELAVHIEGGERALPWARALLAWLAQHGSAVADLELLITPGSIASAEEQQECAALVAAALTACSGPSCRLQKLQLHEGTPLETTSWLHAMSALEFLDVGSEDRPLLLHSWDGLSKLDSAALCGAPVQLPAALPATLTCLYLCDKGTPELPPQVTQLSSLRRLALERCTYSPASLDSLASLAPSLTFLRLEECGPAPSLSCLTALRHLWLGSVPAPQLSSWMSRSGSCSSSHHLCTLSAILADNPAEEEGSAALRLLDDLMWLRTQRPDVKVFRYCAAGHPDDSFMDYFNP
ncbi:hypothetical protein ABPG75_010543 [Micractinium tetrahymenae]